MKASFLRCHAELIGKLPVRQAADRRYHFHTEFQRILRNLRGDAAEHFEIPEIQQRNAVRNIFLESLRCELQPTVGHQASWALHLEPLHVIDKASGLTKSIQTGSSGGSGVQNLAYEWDLMGNLKKRKDLNQGILNEEFFYDNLYRLDYSQLNDVVNPRNLDVSYNELGNITWKSDIGSYTYDNAKKHQVTSTGNGWSFEYDNNGNMTKRGGNSIIWTSYNYPSCIGSGPTRGAPILD